MRPRDARGNAWSVARRKRHLAMGGLRMRPESLHDDLYDEDDHDDAVNDDDYRRARPASRAEQLRARRRLEGLLEERRLRRAIEDDWALDEEE